MEKDNEVRDFFHKEINDTKNFLNKRNDVGQLDMDSDPMQLLSFTRGKQFAFSFSLEKTEPLLNEYDKLKADNEVLLNALKEIKIICTEAINPSNNKLKVAELAIKAIKQVNSDSKDNLND